MSGKFISTTIRLALLAGGKKQAGINIRKTDEVKETKAMMQAHQILWSKYNGASKQSVIAERYL
ncbi:hypothetical protein EXU57_06195 [Segetibacter sp. 3557_3]|uniref:hypothetical protein n=1 Tax=Segetibacter sp. 3557_3 TaxID=2547429 RepID=UPI00105870E6|nr:hypothetical protein [Segetibacter sp. 3557_3]TDH28050.1 hypothetical protein EXU57_06195 [Segetibacter sp. 3557_3]